MPSILKRLTGMLPALGRALPWLGGGLLALAALSALSSWRSTLGLIRTPATVADNFEEFATGGGILYRPRLRFRTPEGQLVLVVSHRGSDEIEYEAGAVVPVLYPAGDPQAAIIATTWRVYTVAIWLAVIGTVLVDIGLVIRRTRVLNDGPRLSGRSASGRSADSGL